MTWTTPQDIKDRWVPHNENPPSSDEQLQVFIEDVELQILKYYPLIQARIDDNLLDVRFIKILVSRVIMEYLKTDGGDPIVQRSETVGPFTKSYTIRSGSRTDLTLSAGDLSELAPEQSGITMANSAPHARTPQSPLYGVEGLVIYPMDPLVPITIRYSGNFEIWEES